ncbi:MAG: helix-turn-helix transcriptional regulator [Pseudomonadales bacterium]|jgi:DNA-binding CsgD family transcriptional regulator|nr:helix-turn-helix transcriptional regulator [Pseudomonadales bacterium]
MSEWVSAQWLSDTIGAIYDCAIDPERWPATLNKIRMELNFATAELNLFSWPSNAVLLSIADGITQHWLDMADGTRDLSGVWGGPEALAAHPLGEPAVLSRVNPRVLTPEGNNRYVLEWGRPQGLVDLCGIVLARDDATLGSLGFGRHESAGLIGEREVEIIRLLAPHLQRAVTINRLLDARSIALGRSDAVLDALSLPIVLVGADLNIVQTNSAARAVLAAGDLVQARSGTLATASVGATKALAVAVAQALQDESALNRKGFGVPVFSKAGDPHVLHVLPLRAGVVRPGLAAEAVAAIFIGRAHSPKSVPGDVFAALFDLTPAEKRVFEHITAGCSVAEVAAALSIGVSTVKTHLSHLFDKAGVRCQADLMALVTSFDLPLG